MTEIKFISTFFLCKDKADQKAILITLVTYFVFEFPNVSLKVINIFSQAFIEF